MGTRHRKCCDPQSRSAHSDGGRAQMLRLLLHSQCQKAISIRRNTPTVKSRPTTKLHTRFPRLAHPAQFSDQMPRHGSQRFLSSWWTETWHIATEVAAHEAIQ